MKIRTGFVSNSSSASYCFVGIEVQGFAGRALRQAVEKYLAGDWDEADQNCSWGGQIEIGNLIFLGNFYDEGSGKILDVSGKKEQNICTEEIYMVGVPARSLFEQEGKTFSEIAMSFKKELEALGMDTEGNRIGLYYGTSSN